MSEYSLGVEVHKTTEEILKDAATLHEYLRTYGTLKDQDKPLVVAGILLALDEIEPGGFAINLLTGDQNPGSHDGDKIMNAITSRLRRSRVGPDAKRDKLLSEFSVIQTSVRLNEVNPQLGKTPLRFYTEFLYDRICELLGIKMPEHLNVARKPQELYELPLGRVHAANTATEMDSVTQVLL